MKYECENCKLEFESEDPLNCPRCSSRKIKKSFPKKPFDDKAATEKRPGGVVFSTRDLSGREGKEGWREFHSSEVKACSECGSVDFTLNWKHKEKVCNKCGSIFPLPRRMK